MSSTSSAMPSGGVGESPLAGPSVAAVTPDVELQPGTSVQSVRPTLVARRRLPSRPGTETVPQDPVCITPTESIPDEESASVTRPQKRSHADEDSSDDEDAEDTPEPPQKRSNVLTNNTPDTPEVDSDTGEELPSYEEMMAGEETRRRPQSPLPAIVPNLSAFFAELPPPGFQVTATADGYLRILLFGQVVQEERWGAGWPQVRLEQEERWRREAEERVTEKENGGVAPRWIPMAPRRRPFGVLSNNAG